MLRRFLVPFLLRPGMYVGLQGTRTEAEWKADAVVAALTILLLENRHEIHPS